MVHRIIDADHVIERDAPGVVGVVADQHDPPRGMGLDRHARRSLSAASVGSTGLNQTPLPSSAAAT